MLPLLNPLSPIVKGIPSLGFLMVSFSVFFPSSKEQPPHSSADALAVIEDVEFIDELVHAVAGLCDGAQVSHQAHVVTLLQSKAGRVRGIRTDTHNYPPAK